MPTFVGIDLGTTFSVVAYISENGQPRAIPNENGRHVTPSVIYFSSSGPIIGDAAKEEQALGAEEIAAFFKRHIGDPHFELTFHGQTYTPIDLSALVLKHLKQQAEYHLNDAVNQVVITVPAYFNNMQREATIEAGRRAGLDVLSIISEPTAAALAYGLRPAQNEQVVLVYDLGGGTFDVSIVKISLKEQRVLGTGGDHNLGGKDWDDRIFNYLAQQFEDEFGEEPDSEGFNELLVKAEQAKQSLTARESVDIMVQASGHRGNYTITRELFERLTTDLMSRTERLTEQVLEDINLNWHDLTGVLLVGGSTRMPMVHDYVTRMSGNPPMTTVNPDEAVALGAAVQAAMDLAPRLSGNDAPRYALATSKKSTDVMSHSLGLIAINEDNTRYINSIIIQKNQAIPSEQTRPYILPLRRGNDNKLEVFMTQGETDNPMDCAYLGTYVFSDFPAITDKKAILDINYSYDQNGVVNVTAKERSTGQPLSLSIEPLPGDVPGRFAGKPEITAVRKHLTVYLAFDLSGSMSGKPLSEAQKAAHEFVRQCDLSTTSIGLISFSDTVQVDTVACQDAKKIARGIDGLVCGLTGYGNSSHPFNEIYRRLDVVSGLRYAIVLADGVWSQQDRAVKEARRCHAADMEIIGVGFGSADKKFLKQISSSDENSFFTNMNDLTKTFSTIAQELTESGGGGLRFLKK